MLPTLARRMADRPIPTIRSAVRNTQIHNPYGIPVKLKKVWPPDFSKLSEKEQFRFERRYKRRIQLAMARPRWEKYVRLAQLSTITFVVIYSVLFLDWDTPNQPFQGIRDAVWGALGYSPTQRRERPINLQANTSAR